MRLLHVVPTYLPATRYGGPIFSVHSLCRALAGRGQTVDVFTTNVDGPTVSDVPLRCPIWIDGVQVHYFSSPRLRRLYWSPDMGQALKRRLPEYDFVHLHSVFLWPIWAAAREARHAGVPYVISPRGMLIEDLIRRQSRWAKTIWINLIEKKNLRNAAAIHVTAEIEREELLRFGWRLPQIVSIPNGVGDPETDLTTVSADVKEIAAAQPLVLFLGRISWKKGLDRLLKAFALTTDARLAIVGTNDENLIASLVPQAESLGITERVRFLPRSVSGADKEYLYAAAKLFVLPSYSENFGNTVLEAMRRSLPVLVTPEVGAAQILHSANAGLVVPGTPQRLADGINRLISDPALMKRMGTAGHRYAVDRCGWPAVAAEMERFYESVQSRPREI